eukprot:2537746-Amphidinium_carterae.1
MLVKLCLDHVAQAEDSTFVPKTEVAIVAYSAVFSTDEVTVPGGCRPVPVVVQHSACAAILAHDESTAEQCFG